MRKFKRYFSKVKLFIILTIIVKLLFRLIYFHQSTYKNKLTDLLNKIACMNDSWLFLWRNVVILCFHKGDDIELQNSIICFSTSFCWCKITKLERSF